MRTCVRLAIVLLLLGPGFVASAGRTEAAWWRPVPGTSMADPVHWQDRSRSERQDLGSRPLRYQRRYHRQTPRQGEKGDLLLQRRLVRGLAAGRGEFPKAALAEPLDGWEGEWWLDVRNSKVRQIMQKRLDLAVSKGCDAVDPDNVDGYTNESGFPLTASHQLSYDKFLASEAHKRGLAIGLKNDLDQVSNSSPRSTSRSTSNVSPTTSATCCNRLSAAANRSSRTSTGVRRRRGGFA